MSLWYQQANFNEEWVIKNINSDDILALTYYIQVSINVFGLDNRFQGEEKIFSTHEKLQIQQLASFLIP